MSKKELIAAVEGRYADWYGSGDEYTTECTAGDWSLRDAGETLSHAIVREDVPELLRALTQAQRIEVADSRVIDFLQAQIIKMDQKVAEQAATIKALYENLAILTRAETEDQ